MTRMQYLVTEPRNARRIVQVGAGIGPPVGADVGRPAVHGERVAQLKQVPVPRGPRHAIVK
jgi:hypothetical protein